MLKPTPDLIAEIVEALRAASARCETFESAAVGDEAARFGDFLAGCRRDFRLPLVEASCSPNSAAFAAFSVRADLERANGGAPHNFEIVFRSSLVAEGPAVDLAAVVIPIHVFDEGVLIDHVADVFATVIDRTFQILSRVAKAVEEDVEAQRAARLKGEVRGRKVRLLLTIEEFDAAAVIKATVRLVTPSDPFGAEISSTIVDPKIADKEGVIFGGLARSKALLNFFEDNPPTRKAWLS